MGFTGFDQLLRAQTVLDDLEFWDWEKTQVTAGALVANAAYDYYEAGPNPAANTFPTGSKAFKAVRNNSGSPQAGGVAINAIAPTPPTGGKTRHLTYAEHDGGNVANAIGDIHFFDLLGFYCDFDLSVGGTQTTGTGAGVADVTRYTSGPRNSMWIVSQVVFGGTSPTLQIDYTDGSLASVSIAAGLALVATCPRGRICSSAFFKLPTPKGVVAVRQITMTGGAAPTGKIAVMIGRQMGKISHATAQQSVSKSFVNPAGEFSAPKWDSDAVPHFVLKSRSTPTTPTFGGQLQTTKGYAT